MPNPTTPAVDVAEGRRLLEALREAQAITHTGGSSSFEALAQANADRWFAIHGPALLRAASENVSLREQVVSANEQRDAAVREVERLRAGLRELAEPPGPHADEIAWNMAERAEQILASATQESSKSVDATEGRLGGANV